jgi:radical SAM protein with 4Fe4S-binding SPASM domain
MIRPGLVYLKYLYYLFYFGSPLKIFNFFLNKIEMKTRRIYLRSMPVYVMIGVSDFCGLNCPGCPTGANMGEAIERKMMNFAQFKLIFDQVKKYIFNLNLFILGEPFLNQEIFSMIEYASFNRCATTIHSNFNTFDEKMAEEAIKSGLTHIYLSIDGATQEVYEQYRKGGDLAKVFRNIEIMVKKKKEMKSLFPLLTWKFLYFPHNFQEIELARQTAKKLGVDLFKAFPGDIDNICSFGIRKRFDLKSKEIKVTRLRFCNELWEYLLIHPDGSVVPCCHGFRKKDTFGNAYKNSLKEIRNNYDFVSLRKMINLGRAEDIVRPPCSECKIIDNLRSHN